MAADFAKMNKKQLKDFINQNGFYFHVACDKIDADKANQVLTDASAKSGTKVVKTGKEIPTGDSIVVFQGIASQNYGSGEKSRNGYKYDQNGWDFSAYKGNPIILWQHDNAYGGIGHAVAFWWDENNNLCTLFFVDLETLDERNAVQVKKGFVSAISTGAIPQEYGFEENDTGKMYTEDEAEEKFGWENVWNALWGSSDVLTLVVTAAQMIENSLVTIGSNENALAMQNAIGKHFQTYADQYKKDHEQEAPEVPAATQEPEAEEPQASAAEEEAPAEVPGSEAPEVPASEEEPAAVETVPPETPEEKEPTQGEETESNQGNDAENQGEEPGAAENADATATDESEADKQKADENEAKLADALEQIATLAKRIDEMEASAKSRKDEFEKFQSDVFDAVKTLVDSNNQAIDGVAQINSALGNLRISKGMPNVRTNGEQPKTSKLGSALASVARANG